MANVNKRSALSYIPGLKNNAVLQLIIFCTGAYLALAVSWAIIMIVYEGSASNFNTYFLSNIALSNLAVFKTHWWTVLTYGWFQPPNSFMELLSSMLWLYCFGSVVQMLVGPRHIAPLYFYSLVIGGVFYVVAQLLPGKAGLVMPVFLGGRAGIMGLAVAAITLTPNYRFYLTETFSIPLMMVFLVFSGLMLIGTGFNLPIIILLAGGGVTGFAYIRLLKSGYQPGEWIHRVIGAIESTVTPRDENKLKRTGKIPTRMAIQSGKSRVSQHIVDDILDKINQKGYNSLSKEEKEILLRAGKE